MLSVSGRRGWRIVVGFGTGVAAVIGCKAGRGFVFRTGLLEWLRMDSEYESGFGVGRVMVLAAVVVVVVRN